MSDPGTKRPVSIADIGHAQKLIGLEFTADERALMLEGVNDRLQQYQKLRTVAIDNSVPPALAFVPAPAAATVPAPDNQIATAHLPTPPLPDNREALAFYPVTALSQLIRTRQITSLALTELYLARLRRYGDQLSCVVTLTEELALAQAKQADAEIANGRYRGPLHGIPWGAKDLLATRDYPTTWGAAPYQDQQRDLDATVVQRLTAAGAVLVAKLSLGALAWGDVWFGGTTKNPWDLAQGSSGSSAGSAAATAAGLVGFAIGSETYGSIVSPSHRCGVSALRPTFGRVSRHGAMALSWSMDKIGPLCRSVEDCALVFAAIHGADGLDLTAVSHPFQWPASQELSQLRIGYVEKAFAADYSGQAFDAATLAVLRDLGATLTPITLPTLPIAALSLILSVEAAAAFDELTRSNRDDLLVRQTEDAWPNVMRQARLISAVEYVQANRVRTLLMQEMAQITAGLDAYISPSFMGHNLLLTNMTGHPAVVLPNGFTADGVPANSITVMGPLYGETTALAVAHAYQSATDFHKRMPPLTAVAT